MPIYKSYADILILHYIHYFSNLELGFTFGNYEDSPKVGFVDALIKRIGLILIRRDPRNSLSNKTVEARIPPEIMSYVNQSLLEESIENN